MLDIAVHLRNRRDAYAGFVLMVMGIVVTLLAAVRPPEPSLLPGLVGIAVSLLGLVAVGQGLNRSVLRIRSASIEWEKGFGWRWFGRNPVQHATVSAVFVSPQRKSILLAREGKRRPFVLILPVASDFPRAVAALRERLPGANWITSDLPLVNLARSQNR